jgi:hypothetical protein
MQTVVNGVTFGTLKSGRVYADVPCYNVNFKESMNSIRAQWKLVGNKRMWVFEAEHLEWAMDIAAKTFEPVEENKPAAAPVAAEPAAQPSRRPNRHFTHADLQDADLMEDRIARLLSAYQAHKHNPLFAENLADMLNKVREMAEIAIQAQPDYAPLRETVAKVRAL